MLAVPNDLWKFNNNKTKNKKILSTLGTNHFNIKENEVRPNLEFGFIVVWLHEYYKRWETKFRCVLGIIILINSETVEVIFVYVVSESK